MISLTLPIGLQFRQWSDFIVHDLSPYGLVNYPGGENDWQDWAARVIQIPHVAAFNPPNPYYFNQWQDWAQRFVQGVH
jgi:hypothetical protein